MAINIGSIGYNHVHEKGYVSDFPGGPGAYLFLIIKSNSNFIIKGKSYAVNKNSYLLLKPNTPCTYRGLKDNYTDDWFFFWLDKEDLEQLQKNGIQVDIPVYIENVEELSAIIHRIAFEHFSNDKFHEEIKSHYTSIFFYQLSRIISSKKQISPDVLSSKNEKLTYLRTRLFQAPDYFENVDDMADYMHLSRSGFQHMYNKVFGHSVMQDIVAGRIERAKEYLKSTNMTVAEISVKCGYKSEYHFMRQFKEQTSLTPTEYRNSDSWNQIEESRK